MANFKIPDLCGASTQLNLASSKIEDLESQITLQINAEASAAKAAIESKLTDVKLGLDGLVPDLPELPNLNFQSELTSLISFDISTPQGLTQYTSKLNDLKLKFGDTLTKSGKDFDDVCNLFRTRAIEREIPEKSVNEVLSLMEKFGGYAFNKSHACTYAILSYWNAWLRLYYPNEWMASAIHVEKDDEDKLAIYRRECALDGIQISKPSINESGTTTLVNSKGDIMLPLTSIKGVGTRVDDLIKLQPFDSLEDFAERARPNRGMIKALAENGALDCLLQGQKFYDIDSFLEFWDSVYSVFIWVVRFQRWQCIPLCQGVN